MAGKEPEYGPTATAVAENVARLRGELNMSYTDVSDRMREGGWSLSPVAIRRIENKQRKVSPDDLTALAIALRVTPPALLMPDTETSRDTVELTGMVLGEKGAGAPAIAVWQWLRSEQVLFSDAPSDASMLGQAVTLLRSAPKWERAALNEQFAAQVAASRGASDGNR
ncbi:helix-turn-helix domain-containing protein [Nocardia sp. 852002-51101_SCH5132738]|uniref:helix-turn-helix domain-containing protein n=1 Tax=Nocardia sp. 852002-51101_SCH5132738 TaxID=1834095 RepID=UPI000AB95CCD|nr:helix-turn-helix transcriptional regulator [Nocardia sp. 852002-51101_SCH5132738]